MVVREDRRAVVRRRAVRPKKPSRASDRVSRVPDVRDAVAIAVGRVSGSVRGQAGRAEARSSAVCRLATSSRGTASAPLRLPHSSFPAGCIPAPGSVRGRTRPCRSRRGRPSRRRSAAPRARTARGSWSGCRRSLRQTAATHRCVNSWAASAPRTEISSTNAAAPARTSFAPDRVEGAAMLAPAMGSDYNSGSTVLPLIRC